MLLETFPVGWLGCNCSILACETTKEAIVIDPGGDSEKILEIIHHYELKVTHLLHTHAHLDHIGATRILKEKTGALIYLHSGDEKLYFLLKTQGRLFGAEMEDPLPIDHFLEDGQQITFGNENTLTIHTPGHTAGSCCFRATSEKKEILFSGDTLFKKGVGRTDLWGVSHECLIHSIRTKLLTLPDDFKVVPGHGPSTTIGEERRSNPYLR
ncbi:MAG: MBL fold metallo-hydrolase [Planctomycetota bacterium]